MDSPRSKASLPRSGDLLLHGELQNRASFPWKRAALTIRRAANAPRCTGKRQACASLSLRRAAVSLLVTRLYFEGQANDRVVIGWFEAHASKAATVPLMA